MTIEPGSRTEACLLLLRPDNNGGCYNDDRSDGDDDNEAPFAHDASLLACATGAADAVTNRGSCRVGEQFRAARVRLLFPEQSKPLHIVAGNDPALQWAAREPPRPVQPKPAGFSMPIRSGQCWRCCFKGSIEKLI